MNNAVILAALSMVLAACNDWPPEPEPPYLTVLPGETVLRLVMVDNDGALAHLKQVAQNGSVISWMSSDHYTVSMDRGVVVATRGFGQDLMGANANNTLQALAEGGSPEAVEGDIYYGMYRRQLSYLSADNKPWSIQVGCRMSLGEFNDDLVRHVETCASHSGIQFKNIYWLNDYGLIVKSLQWPSAVTGLMDISYTSQ